LLYLLGALDRPTQGEVYIDGVELGALDDDSRAELRNQRLGFVFQFHFLLPEFNVLENVLLPMIRRGELTREAAEDRAYATLTTLGLDALWKRKPGQLSGGQQQRVAIARAVANDPLVILADEPTGSLDSQNAEIVFTEFARLAREEHRTVIMVTHDHDLATRADRQLKLKDGRVIADVLQS
jgi:lipoprotein-releasing system ATP-binding protein